MGACNFTDYGTGATAKEAFNGARETAQYDHGHSGYTGTIAEKDSFVMIDLPEGKEAGDYIDELLDNADSRISDKWGPAGCIKTGDDTYLFFGWASE